MNKDKYGEYLDLLGIFHYILAGIIALFACFPFIHVIVGLTLVLGLPDKSTVGEGPAQILLIPNLIGWMFLLIGSMFIIMGWSLAGFLLLAGKNLRGRKRHTLCLVAAGIECAFMPVGTILGVLTLVLLTKDPVAEMFGEKRPTET